MKRKFTPERIEELKENEVFVSLGSLKKDQVIYNHEEVETLLVDFGNFLLSGERFKSINKDSNFECVTDSDISNWKEKVKDSLENKI